MTGQPRSPQHEAAVAWAAAFNRKLETMTGLEITAAWNGDEAKAHRAQLRNSAPDMLQQLVLYVREAALAAEGAAAG